MILINKSRVSILFCVIFLASILLEESFLWYFDHDVTLFVRYQEFDRSQSVIDQGLQFYTPEKIQTLRVDEALLFSLIQQSRGQMLPENLKEKYKNDPFSRLFDMNHPIRDIVFHRNLATPPINQPSGNTTYSINFPYRQFLYDPWDDLLFKALYCDISGYDDTDFSLLTTRGDSVGGYADTHVLLGLLFLEKNQCFDSEKIQSYKKTFVRHIISAEERDVIFSDLYAERIVFLFWSGYGNTVKKEWITVVRKNIKSDFGWRWQPSDTESSAHATGLALLALIYENKKNTESTFSSYQNLLFP